MYRNLSADNEPSLTFRKRYAFCKNKFEDCRREYNLRISVGDKNIVYKGDIKNIKKNKLVKSL